MKRFALFCMALFAVLAVSAQNSLPVETFHLVTPRHAPSRNGKIVINSLV